MNIEVFCCSGGMAEGLRRAGVPLHMAFDKDADACDSYERNLGHRPVQMDVRDLLRMLRGGWTPGLVHLLVADPPCTPWSRAGKREGLADARDMLRETAELIRLLKPTAYLIGNVPGLQDSTSWHVVQDVIGGLSRHSYCSNDYVQLDAADFGVPQHRVRPFWFGHRFGTCITWPSRTHASPDAAAAPALPGCELKPWVTCRDALEHLPHEELGRPVRLRRHEDHNLTDPDEPAKTVTRNTHGDGAVVTMRPHHSVVSQDAPGRVITASLQDDARYMAWPWNRPSTGVTCDPNGRIGPPNHAGGSRLSQPNAIVLSERAAALLQGFPDGWHFAGKTKRARWSQLGQAMPPPLAEAVGRSIVAWFEKHRIRMAA